MFTIISFLITIIGSINWLTIGLLQYDFIAGVFGFQASVFSRIIYIIFGAASIFLVFKLFKGKGTLAVFSRRNKKDLMKNIEKMQSHEEKPRRHLATSNIESDDEFMPREKYNYSRNLSRHPVYDSFTERHEVDTTPRSLFDEHFDDREDI